MTDLEAFTTAAIEALYFTDTGDTDQPKNDSILSNETRLNLEADCRSFWHRFGCFVNAEQSNGTPEQAGHDFWLTRNGHGAGFWDRGDLWGPYADTFTKAAECYGTFETYVGDDGFIYA